VTRQVLGRLTGIKSKMEEDTVQQVRLVDDTQVQSHVQQDILEEAAPVAAFAQPPAEKSCLDISARIVIGIISLVGVVFISFALYLSITLAIHGNELQREGNWNTAAGETFILVTHIIGIVSVLLPKKLRMAQIVLTAIFVSALALILVYTGYLFVQLLIKLIQYGRLSGESAGMAFIMVIAVGIALAMYLPQTIFGIIRLSLLFKKEPITFSAPPVAV
jgi:hypothetical protein